MGDGNSEEVKLGIGDALVPLHAHVAYFLETEEEFAATLGYLEEGLRGSDHCVIFGPEKENEQVCRMLSEKGFDITALVSEGRLALVGAADTGDAILEAIGRTFSAMLDSGARLIRLWGNIGWLEQGWPSVADLLVMEAKVSLTAEKFPCVVLCLYDTRKLPAIIMRYGALDSHRLTFHGNTVTSNPFCLPAEEASRHLEAMSEAIVELERKKQSVQLYQTIFSNMGDGLVIVRLDPSGQPSPPEVVEMNPVARKISGELTTGDLGACSLTQCFPGLFGDGLTLSCRGIAAGGSSDLGEAAVGARYYRIQLFCLFGNYSAVVFSDITERKRTENALLSLRKLGTMLQSTLEVEPILDDLVRQTAGIVGGEGGIAALCSGEGFTCYRYHQKGRLVPPEEGMEPGPAIPGRVVMQAEPYLSNDARHDPRIDPARAERYGIATVVSTPILDLSGEMVGFLEIHNKTEGPGFTPFDAEQLASAAQIAGLAVRNAMAFRKISGMGARLRESTERYRHLVEGLDAIVWEADAKTFQFTFVSMRAESLLGYPISQWLEEPEFWVNHIYPEDRDQAVGFCRRATSEGKDHRFLYRAIAADGRVVWLRDHARVVFDEHGHVRQLRGLMVDITEAMAVEDSLRKSEARFRSTFEGAGIGMALLDAQGRPLESNPALQAMLGYSDQELTGKSFAGLSHPEDANSDAELFKTLMAGGLSRYWVEKRFIRKDGAEIWGLVTFSAVPGDLGTQHVIGMVEDITERKRGEAAIVQLLEQVQKDAAELEKRVAERTSQLEEINTELDSFAHSVSHDLRAPLRAMQGFVEVLLEDGALSDTERLEYLKRILSAAHGMDRLIQDLLAYSRLSRQDILLQSVDLEKVVRDAAQQLELASGGKKYQLEISGALPEVVGHHAVLVQVVLNLMTNGIKFVPAGELPKLRIWAEQEDDLCRLFVEDNGIGIAPQHQERIFKIFERLHGIESYPGTGVGLAIVRKAVTRLGGRIGVESQEGEGSRFWIELPKIVKGER